MIKKPVYSWEWKFKKALERGKSEKYLRNLLKRWIREDLRGLPRELKIEIEITRNSGNLKLNLLVSTLSEVNWIRSHQLDQLVAKLSKLGIEINVLYLDDFVWEKRCS